MERKVEKIEVEREEREKKTKSWVQGKKKSNPKPC